MTVGARLTSREAPAAGQLLHCHWARAESRQRHLAALHLATITYRQDQDSDTILQKPTASPTPGTDSPTSSHRRKTVRRPALVRGRRPIVRHHQNRMTALYPDGLRGGKIPLLAQSSPSWRPRRHHHDGRAGRPISPRITRARQDAARGLRRPDLVESSCASARPLQP